PRKTVSFIERKLKEVGILRGFETIMTTSGNTTVKVLLNAESMELGDISLREFAITDITKIKQLEEKLRQAERMAALGEMASSFAHGIRNPLTGLMLNFEMLSSGDDLSDEIRQRVMFQMHQGIKKLDSLLREVLSFSNPRQPVMSLIDINESISDSIVLIEPRLQQNRIKLHKELAPGPLFVTMDRDQMENVWLNLLSNAIEAMDNQGTLKVRTMRTDNNSVDVVIKDTGLGIKASQLDKIFEPFYSNKRGGTGLGLAISKKILDSHECGISVRSTSGKGTSFTISFPSSGNRTSLGASEPSV
ncbi:MAG: ATP-binding protein, partial [Gemmatimonadota bacterium]|nr:ATP-binding protein [Gemmatimonadota bacterium]